MIRGRLSALMRRVERTAKNLLREHGVRVPRVLPVEARLTGYRGKTRRYLEGHYLDDTGFADIFHRVPPHARASFLNDWEKGESKKLLIAAYTAGKWNFGPDSKTIAKRPANHVNGAMGPLQDRDMDNDFVRTILEGSGITPPEPPKETITITETLTLAEYEERVRENLAKGKHARRSGD